MSKRARAALHERLAAITPGRHAWQGARIGLAVAVSVMLLATGTMLASGRGLLADAMLTFAVGWIALLVLAGLTLAVGWLLRGVPVKLRALGAAALVVLAAPFVAAGPYALVLGALVLIGATLTGAGMASLARGSRRPVRGAGSQPAERSSTLSPRAGRHAARLSIAAGGVLVGVILLAVVGVWLVAGGEADDGAQPAPGGELPVATFTYGSGDHLRRSEYGTEVDVRTEPVDGSRLLANWTGWRGGLRSRYWGFGPEALPRNATVWYPQAEGRFPLVLIVHGNAPMERPSDTGYAWLARDLASRGYIVASIDQNFLNITLARGWDLGDENDARAWLLLEHLRLWRGWQQAPTHPTHESADLDRIGLIGHSRGGEAVATAAAFDGMARYPEDATLAFDAGFGIDAVVALAPVDGQYEPAGRGTALRDVSYLVVHGGLDGDVFSFDGLRQYQRTTLTGATPGAKAAVYLPKGNHGQFNTVWGRQDLGGLGGRVFDTAAIMRPPTQRSAARTAIVALLDAALRDDPAALAPLRDPTHTYWPADAGVITRLADHTEVTLADFDDDGDPATGTMPGSIVDASRLTGWHEEPMPSRWGEQGTNAAHLAWQVQDPPAVYSLRLPADWEPPVDPVLTLTLAGSDEAPPSPGQDSELLDLTVTVVDGAGQALRTTLAESGGVPPAQRSRRFKPPLPEWFPTFEPVGQSFRIPLHGAGLDPSTLHEVRLVFDQSPTGAVYLEHIGIAEGDAAAGAD